jgi:hypothetical protein
MPLNLKQDIAKQILWLKEIWNAFQEIFKKNHR